MAALTFAVLVIVVPAGVLGDTMTTTVKLAEAPEAKAPMVAWLKATPSLIITDTNSALLGAARVLGLAS